MACHFAAPDSESIHTKIIFRSDHLVILIKSYNNLYILYIRPIDVCGYLRPTPHFFAECSPRTLIVLVKIRFKLALQFKPLESAKVTRGSQYRVTKILRRLTGPHVWSCVATFIPIMAGALHHHTSAIITDCNRSTTLSLRLDLPGFWPGTKTIQEVAECGLLRTVIGIAPVNKLVFLTCFFVGAEKFSEFSSVWVLAYYSHSMN